MVPGNKFKKNRTVSLVFRKPPESSDTDWHELGIEKKLDKIENFLTKTCLTLIEI